MHVYAAFLFSFLGSNSTLSSNLNFSLLWTSYICFSSLQLEVWAKEREAAGLRASLNILTSEVQRLNKSCAERKEAENSLRKKWKKIEEFDARRSELETIYNTLLRVNMVASLSLSQKIPFLSVAVVGLV